MKPTDIKRIAEAGNLLTMEDKAPAKRRRRGDGDEFDGPEEIERTIGGHTVPAR